jgi:hypothetical protein
VAVAEAVKTWLSLISRLAVAGLMLASLISVKVLDDPPTAWRVMV